MKSGAQKMRIFALREADMGHRPRAPNNAERTHIERVVSLGCIVCRLQGYGYKEAECHHVYPRTRLDTHYQVLGLCMEHHRGGFDKSPYISRHPYKKRFISAYGSEESLLRETKKLLRASYG